MTRSSLTEREEKILFTLGKYYYLSAEQICRRFYGKSLSYVQTVVLRKLVSLRLVDKLYFPRTTPRGKLPLVYALPLKGRHWCIDHGMELDLRYRSSEERSRDWTKVKHTLCVNDVFLAAELLSISSSGIVLDNVWHERDFNRQKYRLVYPDGWMQFVIGGKKIAILFEVDRGTETSTVWLKKVAKLVDYVQGPYQEEFGLKEQPTIMVWTDAGAERAQKLADWTGNPLGLFRFSSQEPDTFLRWILGGGGV